mmetsp:Transcript_14431/g.31283  ORF Transcript_14431/g.31283 Transcript_14431/m.31283 type:complete len:81 (-) Transcript_14431:1370-1612(-)
MFYSNKTNITTTIVSVREGNLAALVALSKVIKLIKLTNEVLDAGIASKSNTSCNHKECNSPIEVLHPCQVHKWLLYHAFA